MGGKKGSADHDANYLIVVIQFCCISGWEFMCYCCGMDSRWHCTDFFDGRGEETWYAFIFPEPLFFYSKRKKCSAPMSLFGVDMVVLFAPS